jgi:DNA-binding NarL/FixJ family response regulator
MLIETAMTTSRKSRCMATGIAVSPSSDQLSPCERELLRYVVEGHSHRAIASQLGLAETTVQVQLRRLLSKIRVANRTQATIWALANIPELMVRPLARA